MLPSVLFVTSEMAPWVKTGGLGDVAAALPASLHQAGVDIRVLIPCYPALRAAFPDACTVAELPTLAPALPPARLLAARSDGLPLLLLDCPALFERPGNPYLDASGADHPDNALRFGLLSRVAARLGQRGSPLGWQPDVVHVNDWQCGLAPAYLHYEGGAPSVITVHNIAFQGCFGHDMLAALGLPGQAWRFDGVEYYNQLSFLKAGLQFATRLSTVSPTYASEIQTEHFGYALAPLLRYRAAALRGILNGIDTTSWNPATDAALHQPYSIETLADKALNKSALQDQMGLPVVGDRPLFGVISRLTHQKGLDLLLAVADGLPALPAQLVVLGSGDKDMEAGFLALAQRHPAHVAVRIGFDETLAHRIEAGADSFLMPSRFEPCGLNQMYSLRYGTPPVVRATGGLADTVVDCDSPLAANRGNGFWIDGDSPHALWSSLERVSRIWRDSPRWAHIQRNAMRQDFSWKQPAREYIALYREATTSAELQ